MQPRPSDDEVMTMAALNRLIGWARGDHICKRCKGEGELSPTEDDYMPCPDCDGEGEVEL